MPKLGAMSGSMFTHYHFKQTRLWQEALDLAIQLSSAIRNFPESERQPGGLYSRLLETATRIPSRIAESHEPFLQNADELLNQAFYHLLEMESLLDKAAYQGYMDGDTSKPLFIHCLNLREMIISTRLNVSPQQETSGRN